MKVTVGAALRGRPRVELVENGGPPLQFTSSSLLAFLTTSQQDFFIRAMKLILVIAIALTVFVTAFSRFLLKELSPVQATVAHATPAPTPNIDPNAYLKPWNTGRTITIRARDGEDLGLLINAADKQLTDSGRKGVIKIVGGGSIKTQVTFNNDAQFDSSTYSCDVQGITDQGCFLLADNTRIEGTWRPPQALLEYFKHGRGWNYDDPYLKRVQALTAEELAGTGTTILEPTFVAPQPPPRPQVTVFQAVGDVCCSHTDKAEAIAVRGFHIKGRQKVYDGGVRSTILLGNCHNCTAQENYLEDTASIGITAGGSALEFRKQVPGGSVVTLKDNHARNVLFYRNVTAGVAAANIASINGEEIYIGENYARRPGHKDEVLPDGKPSRFGGGVCHVDFESNSAADHTGGIVWNNLSDYEGAAKSGNAMCLQDPYRGVNHKPITAVNNIVIGGRGVYSMDRYMSNGFFLNGLTGCRLSNNYVFRTGQNAIQAHAITQCVIEDNDFESTGGGGNSTVYLKGAVNNILRRNNYRGRPGLTINVQPGFVEVCGSNNTYEKNLTLGRDDPNVQRRPCP